MVTNSNESLIKNLIDNAVTGRITKIVLLAIILIVSLSACSTLSSMRKHAPTQENSKAKAETAPAVDDSFAYDESVDEWEHARAAYIRDLDYAEIFHQHNDHQAYLVKSDLIESRYDLASAETAMDEEKNFPKARTDFQLAEQRLKQAIRLANPSESKDIKATEINLDNLEKSASLAMDHSCAYPYTDRYRKVEGKIEHLLMAL